MSLMGQECRLEQIILKLADKFDIQILYPSKTVLLSGALVVVGGLIGGYAGGRMGALVGAGIGGTTAFVVVKLRQLWPTIKEKLKELIYIVLNFLRRLDPVDIDKAYEILMACTLSRRDLVFTILDFIAYKLGQEVISSISNNRSITL